MGNNLRGCLAYVLPCGALDLVRIVHLSGRIDEYGRAVSAGEVLATPPNHVLSRPCSSQQGAVGRILIVSPESELERGEIYFLILAASVLDMGLIMGGNLLRADLEAAVTRIVAVEPESEEAERNGGHPARTLGARTSLLAASASGLR
ncbi:hypothetical protein E2562_023371 [Oryza meyeriana var. granulata]|uniref:Uncharacterized protein n=1 Tax=Oryza meyeriana var. granulata TaxID=110450 RepID=A0A6G1E152_9ORYZ|nr:hypothetical protein E2562_023371 [Oryza meyeriana var. granulata]